MYSVTKKNDEPDDAIMNDSDSWWCYKKIEI
jgi:hypothetical protein